MGFLLKGAFVLLLALSSFLLCLWQTILLQKFLLFLSTLKEKKGGKVIIALRMSDSAGSCSDNRQLSLTFWAALVALFPLPDYINRQKHFFTSHLWNIESVFSCVIIQFANEIKAAAGESWRCFVNFKVVKQMANERWKEGNKNG